MHIQGGKYNLILLIVALLTIVVGSHSWKRRNIILDIFSTDSPPPEFDFIVVGAGSAGSVVANRLSEIEGWNILLLEAGGDENFLSNIPIIAAFTQLTSLDWNYKSEPLENACLGMVNRRSVWSRGKVLGGTSGINYMLYVRGNKKDYDRWDILGNSGWSYKDVLPYFKKSEHNENTTLIKTSYHSSNGYQTVSDAPYETALLDVFIEAGKELGYEEVDINGENQTGFSKAQGTIRMGSRCSTNRAYLEPVNSRSNLVIAKYSHVTKILIDPETKKAYGIEFQRHGKIQRINATKEVILSAGAVNSPQILMLSGVGPKAELDRHQIPIIQDLSVGHNLMDHVTLGGLNFLINTTEAITIDKLINPISILEYILSGKGILTIKGATEGIAFVNTKYTTPDYPDIEFHFTTGAVNADGGLLLRKSHGLSSEFYKKTFEPYNFRNVIGIIPVLLRPNSRGTIKLRSTNPFDAPLIYPNYLMKRSDVETLIEGAKIAMALSKTKAFQSKGATLIEFPDCGNITKYTDLYWECMIRYYSLSIYHPSGTCKMGPASKKDAVVDPQLKVHGIQGLRVIDSSIFPDPVSGNPNAATIMIGEKGSDFIKEFWQDVIFS